MARKKMNKKTANKIYFGLGVFLIVISLIFIGLITYMNFIPTKYFLILFIILFLLVGSTAFILMYKKIKQKLKTSFSILALILIIIFSIGIYYISNTIGFLGSLDSNYKLENYSVIVLKDSSYNELKDLDGKTISYSKKIANTKLAIEKLEKEIGITAINVDDQKELVDKFLDGVKLSLNDDTKAEAIVLEDTYLSILKEEQKDFEEKIRVIYNFSIKIKVDDFKKNVDVTKDSFNVYISGIDTYGDISTIARSDVNIIATVNPNTNQVLLTSIPRDYYVQLHGTTGLKDKLTHAGMYGIDMSVQTIEDLLDIDINYYIRVNFNTLINLVDTLGGVTVYSDYTFNSKNMGGYSFTKGYNKVDGQAALAFSRERYSFEEGDRQRGKNQQAVITAIIKKAASPALITNYNNILSTLGDSFQTNMPQSSIMALAKMQIDEMPSWNVKSISLNGSDSYNFTYSYSYSKNYVMEPIPDTIINAKKMIDDVEGGKILTDAAVSEVITNVNDATVKKSTTNSTQTTNSNKQNTTSTNTNKTNPVSQTTPVNNQNSNTNSNSNTNQGVKPPDENKTNSDDNTKKEENSTDTEVKDDNTPDNSGIVNPPTPSEEEIKEDETNE